MNTQPQRQARLTFLEVQQAIQPQRQARLTFLEVQQAIQQLQEQGFNNPSIRQIYAALGHRGSFSKIMELKQQVLANALPQISNGTTYLDNSQTQSLANSVSPKDNTLANIEPHLWESFQTRLEEWWSKQNSTHQQLEDLQKQVQELTMNLQEMYQLWQDSIQSHSPSPPSVTHEKVKETTTPAPVKFPNPQQTRSFVFWTQQQGNSITVPGSQWWNG